MSAATGGTSLGKSLPHNLDAEKYLLGAILLDNKSLALAVKYVSSGDFFFSGHQKIFRRMIAMVEAGQTADWVTLVDELQNKGEAASVSAGGLSGAAYIAALTDGMPRVTNVEHYAKIVRQKATLRRLAHAGQNISQQALEPDADLPALQAKLRALTLENPEPMKVIGGNGHLSYSGADFLTAEFPTPEHLVEGLIPRGGSVLIFALPHRLKSWFTTALALECTAAGMVMGGKLEVKKPVRTLLVQVEDFPGQLQWRMRTLLQTQTFQGCELNNVRVIPRCGLNLPDEAWYQNLLREIETFKADHVILDVVRRIFRGDINSPKDTAAFLEQVDRLREATGCTVTLVHHSNKKDADLMQGAAGSYNFPGWANVVIEFKRKTTEGHVAHVEIEVDNKLAQSPEPMRMVLDLTSETPVRLELLEDGVGLTEAEERLGSEWTVRDLAEVFEVAKPGAFRRLKKWISIGRAEKISAGKRGRTGGLARYRFIAEVDVPPRSRRDLN